MIKNLISEVILINLVICLDLWLVQCISDQNQTKKLRERTILRDQAMIITPHILDIQVKINEIQSLVAEVMRD